MQSLLGKLRSVTRLSVTNPKLVDFLSIGNTGSISNNYPAQLLSRIGNTGSISNNYPAQLLSRWAAVTPNIASRCITTSSSSDSVSRHASTPDTEISPRIKFKRLDKTARNIMQILDKEAVEEVRAQREIPDIKPGYIIQLKVETPENKRRISTLKGIVIARRNAGLNTTIRLRRLITGIGIESLFPLYSPNIKEIKVLDKKKVRRAKLYYLRDRLNPLKNK